MWNRLYPLPTVHLLRCKSRALDAALIPAVVIAMLASGSASEKRKGPPALRWAEDQPGCTFSRDNDGKYRYALWTSDYGATLAVDSQELAHVHKRAEHFFSVQLTVHYRGKASLLVLPNKATLEFVKHGRVVQPSLDPGSFVKRIQDDMEQLQFDTAREVKKHPERKEERERYVQAYQSDALQLTDFVNQRSLRSVSLDSANPDANGWILFSAQSKWIGDWKRPEEFVLRIPFGQQLLEFPFMLPPKEGDFILRQRGN